ncbi:MAG TPA: FAD-dependent oxidoreductase, partial [Candidatus Nitrosotenuis sp.]|nr:FAD-dependent oxidoreductase [Candidatus Nitrosotenuis sp.]
MLNVFKKISKLIYWHKNINQLTWVIVGLLIIRSVGAIESGEGDPFQVGMEQLGKVCQNDLSPKYYLDYLEEGQTVLKKADSQDRVNTEQLYQICCSYLKLIGLTHLDPSVCRQMWVWLNEWLTRLASSRPSQDQIYVLGRKLIKAATERRLEQLTCQEILAKSRLWAHQMMNKNSHPIADQAYQIGKDYLKACRKYQECCFNEAYQIALSESETWLEAADRWAGVNPEIAYGDELTYPWTKKRQSDYSPQVIKDWLTKAHNNHDYTYWLGIYHLENQPSSAQYWLKKSLKSRDRVAAAYHLGMLYALTIPYNSHHKITAHKWFVRAEQWDQKDLRTCLALRKMWHTKAMTNPAYAYVLTWLSQMPDIHKLIPEDFASWDQISKIAKEYNGALSESLGHISEFVKKKPLKCVVIGGGYTGILSAVQLARLKDINDKPLFKVTLLEQNSTLLNGASMVAGRLHLGGEYPLDTLTALDCLYAGLLFWQMIPQGYTKIPGVTYLIDKKSEEQPQSISDSRFLNRAKMIEEYRKIQARYEIYYHHLKKDDRYLNNSFFGEPKNLLQIVEPHDEVTKGFAGGIETRERGINPALMGAFLEEQLKISGVKVRFFEKVIEAVPEIYGYKLKTHLNHYQADIVVNATWDQAPSLDLEVLEAQDRDHYPDKLLV